MMTAKLLTIFLAILVAFAVVSPVMADGNVTPTPTPQQVCVTQYGGTTTCTTTSVPSEVVHTTVNAGLGDLNVYVLAIIMLAFGTTLFAISKLTAKAYFLD